MQIPELKKPEHGYTREEHPGNAEKYDAMQYPAKENSPLKGKHLIFLGSSVTEGYASLHQSFVDDLEHLDGVIVIKEAVSGTTLVDVDAKGPSYIKRLRTIDQSFPADALICQLSTNDASQGMPLGTVTDERDPEAFDVKTIAGAIEYIIAYAQNTWHCPVLFYSGTRFISDLYQSMTELLPVMQEKWNIGLIDLWNHEEMYEITDEAYKVYMFDPVHPTRAGYLEWWTPVFEKDLTAFFEQ